uniref:Rpi-vnt1 n=1 Tax=Solanum tuberosum TaxID=4113 RepID=M1C9B0_SOLTU
MWVDDKFCEPRLLHRLINLRTLCIKDVSGSTIKILSALSPVPKALEVLKLRIFKNTSEQINLSSHPNIVKLVLFGSRAMLLNIEAFPPNLVKLTLVGLMVDGHLLAVLKKLPKLRILTLLRCRHDAEKMDLSGDSFPQLEVLHIEDAQGLSEVTCMDDMSMPKLKKLLLVQGPFIYSPISLRVSERLAMLRI